MGTRVVEVAPDRFDDWLIRFRENNPDGPQRILGFERFECSPLAVVLIRRGGYAVALVEGRSLLAHKVGSRHVQSRTAAGGWSQQRFARRRANQADALVGAVREHLLRVLHGHVPGALLTGGERGLVGQVLADPRLRGLREVPRRDVWDLPDPTRAVLHTALVRARAVRVLVEEPHPPPAQASRLTPRSPR